MGTDKIIKTLPGFHSDEELGVLYVETSAHAKAALWNIPQPGDEQKKQKEALENLHKSRILLLKNTPDFLATLEGLPVRLDFYKEELAKTIPASFFLLTSYEALELEKKLFFTYNLLYRQYQWDLINDESPNTLAKHHEWLDLCVQRKLELEFRHEPRKKETNFPADLVIEVSFFNKCLSFLGLTLLAEWLVEKIDQFRDCKTATLNEWISEINAKRLYWVWAGSMLSTVLELLSDDFFHVVQARETLGEIAHVASYLSWILYYLRLGFCNLLLVFKHGPENPWMKPEESQLIPLQDRFRTQWKIRKFALLNDVLWAPVNMLCALWLKGSGFAGYAGNLATALLLFVDLVLNLWRYWEERTKHKAAMLVIDKDIAELRKQEADYKNDGSAEGKAKLEALRRQITELEKMQTKAKLDWKYKEYAIINDCFYSLALMISFCVLICLLCPPATFAPLSALAISVCGAAACFLVTTIYTAAATLIEIAKTKELNQMARRKAEELLVSFKNGNDPSLKKRQYLEIKALLAESEHQRQVADFQFIKGVRSLVIDALFPLIVFTALVFLPTGAGLGIIAATIAVAIVSYTIMRRFAPKEAGELPEFDEAEYETIARNPNPDLSLFEPKKKSSLLDGFFGPLGRLFGREGDDYPSSEYFEVSQ